MLVFASAELATMISPLVWLALIFSRISHSYNDGYFLIISIMLSVIVYGGIHGYLIRLKPLTVNQLMVNLSLRFLLTWAVSIALGYAVISVVELHDS